MKTRTPSLLDDLPGADFICEGLADHHAGRRSIAACLVRIAGPRLHRAGLVGREATEDQGSELELYQLLAGEGDRAYSCYNSLLRRLASFEHALDQRLSRANR